MTANARRPTGTGLGRDAWLVLAVTIAVVAMLLSLLSVGFAIRAIEQSRDTSGAPSTWSSEPGPGTRGPF